MATPILWEDSLIDTTPVSGSTMFGYYDSDSQFVEHAKRAAKWCVRRLGYPVMDVELSADMLYSCYEEAVTEYSSQVHQFTIRENLINLQGQPSKGSSNYTNFSEQLINPSFHRVIEISENYGMEVGVGGNVRWKKGYIDTEPGKQDYDLNKLWADVSESAEAIEIKRIYHQEPVAFGYGISGVYNAPGLLGSAGAGQTIGTLSEFGWEGMAAGGMTATGLSYTIRPLYEDLLRMQTIELNFQIRRSGYGFQLRGNNLRLFPVPMGSFRMWFEYILKKDRISGYSSGSNPHEYVVSGSNIPDSITTNLADAPYENMRFSNINDPGRRWILKYMLSCAKGELGEIRSKYTEIPIPNSTIVLNGDQLKSESDEEKRQLIEELREDLERTSTQTQLEIQASNTENISTTLKQIPLKIYVG